MTASEKQTAVKVVVNLINSRQRLWSGATCKRNRRISVVA